MIAGWFIHLFRSNKILDKKLHNIIGFYPDNQAVYSLALKHVSLDHDPSKNNERLEFLGDAVLDTIIADYLFKKYPMRGEGFLTEVKSKIVSRKKLGEIGRKMGLDELINVDEAQIKISETIFGNTLEALIGAIFLDQGYNKCKEFIHKKIIEPHIDLDDLLLNEVNYKSKFLEWAQSLGHKASFDCIREEGNGHKKQFWVNIILNDTKISTGIGSNKKNAEKEAARIAIDKLKI